MIRTTWLYALVLFSITLIHSGVLAEISEQEAVESAHKAIAKFGVLPKGWTFHVEKDLQRWESLKRAWEESSKTEKQLGRADTYFGPSLVRMESVMRGRNVWTVVYKLIIPPGQRSLHPNAMVFVDADSGSALALIEPEGSAQFPN